MGTKYHVRHLPHYVRTKAPDLMAIPCYAVSDSAADTIVDVAATLGVSRLILGSPQRSTLLNLLRGDIIRQVSSFLPEPLQELSGGFSLARVKVQPTEVKEDVRFEAFLVPITEGLLDQSLNLVV